MLTYRTFVKELRSLPIDGNPPVIAHVSLSAFGEVEGGANTLLGALLTVFPALMMPTFTYKTMITPHSGPPNNGIEYGNGDDANRMAEFFWPHTPPDALMGVVAKTLLKHPKAQRSLHPILSFGGINITRYLEAQSIEEPLAPIHALMQAGGWVLLVGVDHTVNTSIHLGERLAGRKTFTRWALTPKGIITCPGFPGCSKGFNAIEPHIKEYSSEVTIGQGTVRAMSVSILVEKTIELIHNDPFALLCNDEHCLRCKSVRSSIMEGAK